MKIFLFVAAFAMFIACAPERPPEPVDICTIEPSTTQALEALQIAPPELTIVLDEQLGGLACSPGNGEACQQTLEQQCVGDLDAVVGVESDVVVALHANGYGAVTVASVTVSSSCGWSLDDTSGFVIDAGASVPVTVHFEPREIGVCEGRFAVVSDEGAFGELDTDTIILRATVVAETP